MATLASSPPTAPSWPKRRPRAWALRCERYCCAAATCFPLAFVYGVTTWAVYVAVSIGIKPSRSDWIGTLDTSGSQTLNTIASDPSILTFQQVSPAPFSHSAFTSSSTSRIVSPSSPIQGRRYLPVAGPVKSTAPSHSLNTRSSHHTPLPRPVNPGTARNASAQSRTARITARRANDASSRWTITVPGSQHVLDCIITRPSCYF
jgi:hypothetical protein